MTVECEHHLLQIGQGSPGQQEFELCCIQATAPQLRGSTGALRAAFLDLDDELIDLTAEQENSVTALVDQLPDLTIQSEFDRALPGDRSIRVRLLKVQL